MVTGVPYGMLGMDSHCHKARALALKDLIAIPPSESSMPDHNSGEQLAGPGSKVVQARNNWFSRAASFILSQCMMSDIGHDANYHFGVFNQINVSNVIGVPSTLQSHAERIPEANGLSQQLLAMIY